MTPFTHLQVHSSFTLLGGTASVPELAARAAAEGMTHLALTDTNVLYGAVAFDQACRAAGIEPVLGMTVTVAPPSDQIGPVMPPGRLVLLATGLAGYRSLCRLSSRIQAYPERETLAAQGLGWEELRRESEGLVCLSGGRRGWVERFLRAGDRPAAKRYAGILRDIYGDRAYLSVELHQPGDRAIVEGAIALGEELGLKALAVQPVYCLSPEDRVQFRLLAAVEHNLPLAQVPPSALPDDGDPALSLHWLSREEVATRFAGLPDAVVTTEEVINRCGPALPDGRPIWPKLKLAGGETPDEALARQAQEGLEEIYGPGAPGPVRQRLQVELAAIVRSDYAPLFLVVADIVRFARESGIPVNTRGSVANSLVAHCTGITNVDPIAHDLLFERFLNPARSDASTLPTVAGHGLPDIDLDFCSRRRDEVLEYVRCTYGPDRVALVATVATLRPRGAVRETAKAYGLDEAQIKRLVTLLPRGWHPDPRRRDRRTVDDVLAELDDARLRTVVQAAYDLVGRPHHLSVHPGGVVITPGPLTDVVPLQWAPKGFLITQFGHEDVEAVGLPKIDLLGIRALTVLTKAESLVQRHYDPAFRLSQIPSDDPATARLLSQAATIGVFQCESTGAQRTLRQLRARSIRDLAVANAFFKPGPATGGMARTFVRRYRGEEPVSYLHPALAPVLSTTKGILLFQEQILRVAREIAGLSWEEADQLRRGMSHFGRAEMTEMQDLFIEGCRRPPPDGPGFTRRQAETLWEQVLAFAGYGFNQGHATSYAVVSYRSAYLKAHWPAAFLGARLSERGGFHHPAIYMAEARRLGLAVRPPHVNHSRARFTLGWEGELGVLWMGLGQVRDLRRGSIRSIAAQQPFDSLRDLLQRVPLQPKEINHLIQCGALDGLGDSRAATLAAAEEIRQAGSALQLTFDLGQPAVNPESSEQRLRWEQQLLGQPVSLFPLDLVRDRLPAHVPLSRLPEQPGLRVTVAGARLPGWTGGQGFFLGDGETFIIARGEAPSPWHPLLVRGRWLGDEWGGRWLQVEDLQEIEL